MDLVLRGHEPFPALAVDRHWHLVAANRAVSLLLAGIPAELLAPPVNVLRLSLHPQGLAPRIENLRQWRTHVLHRLEQQISASADAELVRLRDELARNHVAGDADSEGTSDSRQNVVIPLRLRSPAGVLSFISTTTVFGTPVDITLSELALETFFPADDFTAQVLRSAAL